MSTLDGYDGISPQIMLSAILSNLSYSYPYNESRIISDIVYNDTLYVVFTGTQPNMFDMSFNVNILKSHQFGGRVHSGFHKRAVKYFGGGNNATFDIWFNNIFKNAEMNGDINIKEIVFAGHSLGGAASEIVGTYFWQHCNKNSSETFCSISSQIITFGGPLIFQKACNVHPNMTHIVNDNDMIPRILRDFEFLYSGFFTIRMLSPHIPHIFAVTVFLSLLSVKYTRYDIIQVFFVCSIWILTIYHFFSSKFMIPETDVPEHLSPILNIMGCKNVFCDSFHLYLENWVIHLILVLILMIKRLLFSCLEGSCDCLLYLFQPILDFIPSLLRMVAIFVPCFVGICFIAPHYYGQGDVIHIQMHHKYGVCNKLNAIDYYNEMRTGYEESFFFHDHSIVIYTEILQSLINGKIKCGTILPESSTGNEVEDAALLVMFILCIAVFWIYFIKKQPNLLKQWKIFIII